MRSIPPLLSLLTLTWLAGCAAHPDPIIDLRGVDREQFEQDWNDCDAYSEEVSIAEGTAKGAATGAVVGAITGAVIGGNSTTVRRSAGYYGTLGGATSGLEAAREKDLVFKRCMAGRGYNVLN